MVVCDRCGGPILDRAKGALTWTVVGGKLRDFRILHHRCIPEGEADGADPWQVDLDGVAMAEDGRTRVFAYLLESICRGAELKDRRGLLACLQQLGYGG